MAKDTIAQFQIERLNILAPDGEVEQDLLPDLTDSQLLQLYELLQLTRIFDERAISLQREGRLGTYPSSLGQEASQVGSGFAMTQQDWLFPSFRELGVYLCQGYPPSLIYQYWAGDERGQKSPAELNIFPLCIAVGTHVLHAAGAAMGAKLKGDKTVAVAYIGDGATSKGDFHEALNMAAVYRLPLVVICQNNQWAISVPRKFQTRAQTIAQKAIAYGIHGIQVDGNDVLAVYQATFEALQRARKGGGPTFIECETYRMQDHTTADDARRYRDPEELEAWKDRDPILRMRRFLEKNALWNPADQLQLEETLELQITEAIATAEASDPPAAEDIFTYSCHQLSTRQQEQLKECTHGGS